ncbi:HlyD family efflux transporter periplasmic adaptor subunit [bacterium]|nr:MAG: HlyD family efflux transporter periplasmic adaptor subunit [bacterium]
MSPRNRTFIASGAAAVLVLTGVLLHGRQGSAQSAQSAPTTAPAQHVQTAAVRIGSVAHEIRGEGRVAAASGGIAQLSFAEPGRIAAVDVHAGQHVTAGEVVARLDLTTVGAAANGNIQPLAVQQGAAQVRLDVATRQLERARRLTHSPGSELSPEAAQVRQDQARLQGDRSALARQQTLLQGGVAALKDVEAARQQVALDAAALAADRAKLPDSLLQARQNYAQALSDAAAGSAALEAARRGESNAVLRAPIDGVVTSVERNPGEWADAGAVVATVVNPDSAQLRVALSGDQAALVEAGNPVRAGSAGGRVLRVVRPLDPTTQMGQAVVAFDGAPRAAINSVLPVDIQTGVHRGVTLVPSSAVVQDPADGEYVVFVRNAKGTFDAVKVTLGWSQGGWQEVHSQGIKAGQTVATYGSYELLATGASGGDE